MYKCSPFRFVPINRSSQLRRLEILYYYGVHLTEALKKLPLLEELSLVGVNIAQEYIEVVGCYCPLLKTLKVNKQYILAQHEIAFAIGKNLPELIHLELVGDNINNTELQAILDGCCHLESLDLRGCENLDLTGDLGKRCSQQIEHLKLPHHSLERYPYAADLLDDYEDEYEGDYDYDDLFDYNDYSASTDDGSFNVELMMEKMTFKDMFE
ncbi:putative F-box/LRR-repeat protein 22 [Bidens hawaiensis]|uniref:putative F-box/LRR-repeat protein 22 n=1 Tax=Bidens hawaiensis TaxID=980011 RepID=UPI00404A2553